MISEASQSPIRSHAALLRGINVGGRNKIKMADLRQCFLDDGFTNVLTYIQSGNVVFTAEEPSEALLESKLENILARRFAHEVRVLVRSRDSLERTVGAAPTSFGAEPGLYHYDVMFLSNELNASATAAEIPLRPGVDEIHAGSGVVYFRRLSSQLGKSRLSRITQLPLYQEMTIRNWRTTNKILTLLG